MILYHSYSQHWTHCRGAHKNTANADMNTDVCSVWCLLMFCNYTLELVPLMMTPFILIDSDWFMLIRQTEGDNFCDQ